MTQTTPHLRFDQPVHTGLMIEFTSDSFRRIREILIKGGWTEVSPAMERAAGGPTFQQGHDLLTLETQIVGGFPYLRVRQYPMADLRP